MMFQDSDQYSYQNIQVKDQCTVLEDLFFHKAMQ